LLIIRIETYLGPRTVTAMSKTPKRCNILDLNQGRRAKLILLLRGVDGDKVRQRGSRAKLALGIPVKHDLHLDTKNTLQKAIQQVQSYVHLHKV
jgi:hypothetical protein